MRIDLSGIARKSGIAEGALARTERLLTAQPFKVTTALVRFTDENGPKGGEAIRCGLTVKVPRRPPVHVEDVDTSARLALDGALAKLERNLTRFKEELRKKRRYPKKYFAAAHSLVESR